MTNELAHPLDSPVRRDGAPLPIVALDFASGRDAMSLVDRLPAANFYKVGLQLYTAAGPDLVQDLKERGHRVFLDLKLHDIPNTVAGAVKSAAGIGVDLLTVHASGGGAMLRAAAEAAASARTPLHLFAVTVLTSLGPEELAQAWGRTEIDVGREAARLAILATECGLAGIVSSVYEVAAIRERTRSDLLVLSPGIRLPGDASGDQARVATPGEAARAGVDYIVVGRSVTAAADPADAFARILDDLAAPAERGIS